MTESRVNKFIFQRGKIFLRLKTTANDLRLKKNDGNFVIEFSPKSYSGKSTSVAVKLIEEFAFPDSVENDALDIGYRAFDSTDLESSGVESQRENWGQYVTFEVPGKDACYFYYLTPKNEDYAVRIGPIDKEIPSKEFEIDWSSVQWGK